MIEPYLKLAGSLLKTKIAPDAIPSHLHDRLIACTEEALSTLGERERDILERWCGIRTSPQTNAKIALAYSVSDVRIGQIKTRALKKLDHPSRIYPIRKILADAGIADFSEGLYDPELAFNVRQKAKSGVPIDAAELGRLPCTVLEVSTRTANALRQANITTLLDLRSTSKYELLMLPNFGRKLLLETLAAAEEFGITLKDR